MDNAIEKLVHSLFGKTSLNHCTEEEIQSLVSQYPYCSSFQMLLTHKMQENGSPSYNDQLKRTSLHFNNPFVLTYLVNGKNARVNHSAEVKESMHVSKPLPEDYSLPKPEDVHNDEVVISNKQAAVSENFSTPETQVEVPVPRTNPDSGEEQAEISPGITTDFKPELNLEDSFEEAAEEEDTGEETIVPEEENLKLRSILEKEMQESGKQKELVIDPQHTIDYFASQGIISKNENILPNDRFSRQLKSFTEWLKLLKEAKPEEVAKNISAESEQKIVTMAGESIQEKDIVTESMAEVWLKQGNKVKAAEVYSKLSLLNPSKSAYFASLIEKIKS